MTVPPPQIDALLISAPPCLSVAQAADLALEHYAITGQIDRLTSERDLNFRLTTAQGRYVLKLANAAEPAALTAFQTAALLHLEATAPDLPVPRVIRSVTGETAVRLASGHTLRLLSYVEGAPLHAAAPTPAQRRSMAEMGARLALALRPFRHPGADHALLWDIKQAAGLRPMLPAIADPDLRALATRCLDTFDARIAPALPGVRWQVVHNDLNPHNVLVDPADPDHIAGILDFGDMVRTPLICDIAVAAAYQVDASDPLTALSTFAAAWHAVDPIPAAELALLYDLVATRMTTTIAIASWRAARYPENATYILRNFPLAKAGLTAFAALNRADVCRALAIACQES